MHTMQTAILASCLLLTPALGRAEHNPLLPRPQQIRYGSGQLRIEGLSIRFASGPTTEDRFAADELASALRARAESPVPVVEGGPSRRAIVLRRTGSGPDLPQPDERPGPDSREAYTIKVSPEGGEIGASSSAGLFYGVQTLRQMVEGFGSETAIPEVEVHDWPSLAYRAVMMDMSHDELLTEKEVKRQIDFMARWKANQYYFYSEASIELEGFALLNPEGRFTREEVRRVIDYARQRHVDVIPCVELYGHLHDLFRVERYADLAVLPHGQDLNALDPRVMTLVGDWVGQLAQLFPSPFLHIGLDETYELEKSAQTAAGMAPGKIYLQHLTQVTHLAEKLGKHVVFWADMNILTANPEIIPGLPPGITGVPWHNGLMKDYSHYLAPLTARHIAEYASTSVYGYQHLFPDLNQTFAALDNLLRDAHQYGAAGLFLTLWSDDDLVLTRTSFPGVAYGMAGAWQSTPVARAEFFSDYARQMYAAAVAAEVAPALQALADSETRWQAVVGQRTGKMLWADTLTAANLKRAQEHREDSRQTRLLAEDAEEHLQRALALGGDPATLAASLVGARLLDYAGMKEIYAAEMAGYWEQMGTHPSKRDLEFYFGEICDVDHTSTADLMDATTELRAQHRRAWLAEYTPYRLGTATGKWDTEFQYWWKLQRRMQALLEAFHDGDTLPPLESFGSGN